MAGQLIAIARWRDPGSATRSTPQEVTSVINQTNEERPAGSDKSNVTFSASSSILSFLLLHFLFHFRIFFLILEIVVLPTTEPPMAAAWRRHTSRSFIPD